MGIRYYLLSYDTFFFEKMGGIFLLILLFCNENRQILRREEKSNASTVCGPCSHCSFLLFSGWGFADKSGRNGKSRKPDKSRQWPCILSKNRVLFAWNIFFARKGTERWHAMQNAPGRKAKASVYLVKQVDDAIIH